MTKASYVVTCNVCKTDHELKVDPYDFQRLQAGELIQNVMSYLSQSERELLISGTCGSCFEQMSEELMKMSQHSIEMTEEDLKGRIAVLGLPEGDARIPGIVCQLIGHSRIVDTFFGYVYCGRCDAQIGDQLVGMFDTREHAIVGHDCKTCHDNYAKMSWKDKFMAKDPFAVVGAGDLDA